MIHKGQTMRAFHGDAQLKSDLLRELENHRKAGQIRQGKFVRVGLFRRLFRGCAVGCTIRSYNLITGKNYDYNDYSAYEVGLGIPWVLAELGHRIFNGLPFEVKNTVLWPERFLIAIRTGADLSGVWPQFALWLLNDPYDGVIRFANPKVEPVIQHIANLYRFGGSEESCRNAKTVIEELKQEIDDNELPSYETGLGDAVLNFAIAMVSFWYTDVGVLSRYIEAVKFKSFYPSVEERDYHLAYKQMYMNLGKKLLDLLAAA